jgi:glycosyltransferase involved in cell wall biosynthesis
VDLVRFREAESRRELLRRELELGSGTVLVYLGSLGSYYMPSELAAFVASAVQVSADTRFLALSRDDQELIRAELRRQGVPDSVFRIRAVAPSDVPAYLGAADIGLSFRRPSLATQACSPTKIGEYLAAGLPVVSNAGVGDTERVIRDGPVGIVLERLATPDYQRAFRDVRAWLAERSLLRDRCRATAARWFDLETVGGPAYVQVYRDLAAVRPCDRGWPRGKERIRSEPLS